MNTPSVSDLLAALHFPQEWIEFGFIDEAYLRNLYEQYQSSEDKNREHYRYCAFRDVLASETLTGRTGFIEQYVRLAGLDLDPGMAKAALYDLFYSEIISINQMAILRTKPPFQVQDERFQQAAERRLFHHQLTKIQNIPEQNSTQITELFRKSLFDKDAWEQRLLLETEGIFLDTDQLMQLSTEGATRAIRNIAMTRLKRAKKV